MEGAEHCWNNPIGLHGHEGGRVGLALTSPLFGCGINAVSWGLDYHFSGHHLFQHCYGKKLKEKVLDLTSIQNFEKVKILTEVACGHPLMLMLSCRRKGCLILLKSPLGHSYLSAVGTSS